MSTQYLLTKSLPGANDIIDRISNVIVTMDETEYDTEVKQLANGVSILQAAGVPLPDEYFNTSEAMSLVAPDISDFKIFSEFSEVESGNDLLVDIGQYYKCEDVTDSVGGASLVPTGTVATVAGKNDNGRAYNASDNLDTTSFLYTQKDFSISMWIDFDVVSGAPLMGLAETDNDILIGLDTTNQRPEVHIGDTTVISTNTVIPTDEFHHYVIVWDAEAGEATVFLDGKLEIASFATAFVGASIAAFQLGGSNDVSDIDGTVDEVVFWDRKLDFDNGATEGEPGGGEIDILFNGDVGKFYDDFEA